MSELEIDFEWPLAAKYELRPATAEEISQYRVHNSRELAQIPESEWPLYLGHIIPIGKLKDHRPKAEIMERAVTVLVECKKTPIHKVALTVARAMGTIFPQEIGDPVHFWASVAERLRMMFEGRSFHWDNEKKIDISRPRPMKEYRWPHPYTQEVGELGIYLVPDKENKPVLALRPQDLQAALKLCAARMIATGTTFNICENCKTPFLSGGIRGRNKRGDARFCSDECRYKFHNESRRKAR
jgi:hypothetical protein